MKKKVSELYQSVIKEAEGLSQDRFEELLGNIGLLEYLQGIPSKLIKSIETTTEISGETPDLTKVTQKLLDKLNEVFAKMPEDEIKSEAKGLIVQYTEGLIKVLSNKFPSILPNLIKQINQGFDEYATRPDINPIDLKRHKPKFNNSSESKTEAKDTNPQKTPSGFDKKFPQATEKEVFGILMNGVKVFKGSSTFEKIFPKIPSKFTPIELSEHNHIEFVSIMHELFDAGFIAPINGGFWESLVRSSPFLTQTYTEEKLRKKWSGIKKSPPKKHSLTIQNSQIVVQKIREVLTKFGLSPDE